MGQPIDTVKVALGLALPLLLATAGCNAFPTFPISAREQTRAERDAFERQAAQREAHGVDSAFLPTRWSHGECHWTQEPSIAVCRTRARSPGAKQWRPLMMAYRREADGSWTSLGPRSLLGD